eukprot:4497345-Pleurochrysis_carterae.AAC.1
MHPPWTQRHDCCGRPEDEEIGCHIYRLSQIAKRCEKLRAGAVPLQSDAFSSHLRCAGTA